MKMIEIWKMSGRKRRVANRRVVIRCRFQKQRQVGCRRERGEELKNKNCEFGL